MTPSQVQPSFPTSAPYSAPILHKDGDQISPFCQLLTKAFPDRVSFPRGCSIVEGFEVNQDDLRSEIATLVSFEADGELIDRLKRQHPTRKVHHPEHDNNFWRAWNEAAAFCWAVSSIDAVTPKFVGDETGLPDIEWGNERWLEVKTVDNSPKEIVILNQQAMAGFGMRLFSDLSSPNPNVLRKFEYHLQDTLLKAARTKCGELVLFLSMRIDGGTSHRKIREAVTAWAVASASHWGVRIVVANGLRWDQPFVDTGPTEGKRPTTHDGSESPQS